MAGSIDERYEETGTVALYLRLSKEDEFLDELETGESNSIMSQRELLRGSLMEYGLSDGNIVEYIDDGYSGKNFNRPAVKQLLEDVRNEKVKTILVKDFSRFGRDHITVGDYVEKIFPFLGVRFIAVSVGYDSNAWIGTTPDMDVGFQNIMNDYYSEENSIKIKQTLNALKSDGKYLANISLYGYLKSEDDKHQLVIDEPAANIVRRIFQYRIDGLNGGEIARILNEESVPTPTEYFNLLGIDKNHRKVKRSGKSLWQASYINTMIRNEEYTGCMIAGRYKAVETGSTKLITTDKSEWIVVPDTHEAIIDKGTFERAQHVFYHRKRPVGKIKPKEFYESPLKGLVRCGGCGHKLTRKAQRNPSYFCKYYYFDYNDYCVETTFPETDLMEIVVQAVKNQILFVTELEQIYQLQNQQILKQRADIAKELDKQKKNQERLKKDNFELYSQYSEGLISAEKYQARKQKNQIQAEASEKLLTELQLQMDSLVVTEDYNQLFFTYKKAADGLETELISAELAQELIECIYIHSKKRVEIEFRFVDQIEELVKMYGMH